MAFGENKLQFQMVNVESAEERKESKHQPVFQTVRSPGERAGANVGL